MNQLINMSMKYLDYSANPIESTCRVPRQNTPPGIAITPWIGHPDSLAGHCGDPTHSMQGLFGSDLWSTCNTTV